MPIIIKRMEMPDCCNTCPCCQRVFAWRYSGSYCGVTGREIVNQGEINENCPLVEAPPHGRLIDADALLDRFERESKSANEHGRDFSFCFMSNNEPCAEWWAVEQIVEDFITTNTVIGAEDGE